MNKEYKTVFFPVQTGQEVVQGTTGSFSSSFFFNWELKAQQINVVSLKPRPKTLHCLRGLRR